MSAWKFYNFADCQLFPFLQPIEPMQVDIAPEVDQPAAEDSFIIEAATIVSTVEILF